MDNMYYAISLSVEPGDVPRDFLYTDYRFFFEKFGCRLVYLPNHAGAIGSYFDDLPLSGVILSGGNDLSAEFTGQVDLDIRNPAPGRDAAEKKILDLAVARKMPVLGICRGMQFINCYFGGSITQKIGEQGGAKQPHVKRKHMIAICDNETSEFLGAKEMEVNSYHHQGIKKDQVAADLKIMAISPGDGIVEAVYHPSLPLVGVQWHPEREGSSPEVNDRLIEAFVWRKHHWKDK